MHLKRWITGIVALPFLILLIVNGGVYFAVLIGVVCLLSMWEYFRIVLDSNEKIVSVMMIVGLLVGAMIVLAASGRAFDLISIVIALNITLCGLISLPQYKTNPNVLETIKKQVQGVIYIPLLLSFLVLIRNQADGMIWIFLILAVIFAGDTSAYYFGSYLGRHKLCPAVSPAKTVEGSIGGLAANLLVGSLVKYFFLPTLPWTSSLLFFVVIGIAGQVGDLFESMLKRSSKVKDSGGLLPGHGGFLDRIDALLFAAPVAYFFKSYLI
ncbi:MAG: phosphatidate cytidylyltransferase [Thermodesulfobacteriota bacterium]|nr:phosphatidate cytidylyltransferase [Thermodesulfobacteriota bacterium]